jgi:fibronectin type 3 domain-containing protein
VERVLTIIITIPISKANTFILGLIGMRKKIIKVTSLIFLLLGIWILSSFTSPAVAQQINQQMRYAVQGDSVFIYHIRPMQPGQGFNIYRKGDDDPEFQKLNDKVVQGITYASELSSVLGLDIYNQIQKNIEAESGSDMFFKLRSNSVSGRLYTFVYPEVAQALGRLYIDDTVQIGENATYKIKFVNDLGEPIGEAITQEFFIDRHLAEAPTALNIKNDGYRVTARWEYPKMGSEDDKVVRFNLYRENPQTGHIERINDNVIIRESDKSSYQRSFQTQQLGRRMNFFVTAIDITGQAGPPSEKVTHFLKDNIPPSVVNQVNAEYIDGSIELTWPVSPESDLEGYYVYKSLDIREGYEKLNATPVKPLETVFQDSSIEEGNRYFYKVAAVDSSGNEGARSAAAMRHIADSEPPVEPSNLQVSFSDDKTVIIDWTLSPKPDDLRRFIILRSRQKSSKTYSQLTGRDFKNYSFEDVGEADKEFVEGAFYRYGIVAADSSRNFSDTTFINIQIPDLTPPDKPSFVRADNDAGIRINVSWNNTGSGDAVKYIAYRQPLDSAVTKIKELPISQNSFRHAQVTMGSKYRYGISVVDSVGNESEPAFSDTVKVRDYDPPRGVRNVRIFSTESGEDGYRIKWEPVVAQDLQGYKVYYSNISTGVYKPLTDAPITDTSFMDPNGQAGRWYRVVAVDISGNESKPSEPVKAK